MDFRVVFENFLPCPSIDLDSYDRALQIVTDMQNAGADLFRGQNQTFPPRSGLHRSQDPEKFKHDVARTTDFMNWLAKRLTAAGQPAVADEIWAVAQHYGFPTAMLDVTFSKEVAFFFAHDGAQVGNRVS